MEIVGRQQVGDRYFPVQILLGEGKDDFLGDPRAGSHN
jgi:hypothetical protein